MPFITSKPYLLFIPFILYFFVAPKIGFRKSLVPLSLALVCVVLSDGVGSILKNLFERPRPCQILVGDSTFREGVNLLVGCGGSFSFPSNHSANAFSFAGALAYFLRKVKVEVKNIRYLSLSLSLFFVATVIAFSRIYVGVHYPSDVIAGALLGVLISQVVVTAYKWTKKNMEIDKAKTIFVLSLFTFTLLRFFYINTSSLELSPDEAHYWDWSRRLDLSYYSKGPVIAYLVAFTTSLLGDTVFAIRFLAPIFLALSSIFVYKLARELFKDEKTAVVAGLLLQITPLFATYGVLMTIDSPFIFFWTLSIYLFWKAANARCKMQDAGYRIKNLNSKLQTPNSKLKIWLLLGFTIGFGLLTKYTMAFFYICAFLFFIFHKENRAWFKRKEPYIAFIVSILVFSLVIIWNAQHDWVTLKHTAGQAHISGQWTSASSVEPSIISSQWVKNFLEFLGSQLGVITPLLFFVVIYGAVKNFASRITHHASRITPLASRFLFWFWAPILGFFIFKSLHGKVQANWAIPAYITAFIASTGYFLNRGMLKRGTKIFLSLACAIALLVTLLSHYPEILNLPSKKDPTSRLRGWKGLGEEVGRIYNDMTQKGSVFIFSESYQVSSELAFYTPGKPETFCVNLGRRMNQYDIWGGFDKLVGKNAIFVRIGKNDFPEELKSAFDSYEKQSLIVQKDSKILREYSIFKCYGFKGLKLRKFESY